MSGDKDAFIVIPNEVVQILPTDWRDKFAALRRFVKKATRGVYGIGRVGSDSSETFAGLWIASSTTQCLERCGLLERRRCLLTSWES